MAPPEIMKGLVVSDVSCKGKVIFIQLREVSGPCSGYALTLISTLGMSGWWYPKILTQEQLLMKAYYNGQTIQASDVVNKALNYVRAKFVFDDGYEFCYTDPRNFGNMTLARVPEVVIKQRSLGLDPLESQEFDGQAFMNVLRSGGIKDKKIGEVLLDQSVICGIGNIYRAESLYLSRISPHRLVRDIYNEELLNLAHSIHFVLWTAYLQEGSMSYPVEIVDEPTIASGITELKDKMARLIAGGMPIPHDVPSYDNFLAYSRGINQLQDKIISEPVGGRTMWWSPGRQI